MDSSFCVDALEEALARFGRPEIFNTDQGDQFARTAFTGALAAAGIRISMAGRGRWMDNVFIERRWRSLKYEDAYLKGYADGRGARIGIGLLDRLRQRPPASSGARRPSCDGSLAPRHHRADPAQCCGDDGQRKSVSHKRTAPTTKASHALRGVIGANQEQLSSFQLRIQIRGPTERVHLIASGL
jgi:transposase InsO family protein